MDAPHTLGRWLTDSAGTHGTKVAVDDRGVRTTYAGLERRSAALAEALRRAGYGPGDRVATLTGNSVDHLVAFFACARTGLALVPLSGRLTEPELAQNLRTARARLVLAEPDLLGRARSALRAGGCDVPLTTLGSSGVESSVPTRRTRPGEAWPAQRPVADDDPLLVIFTSGSESHPKGVVLTHANCFWTNMALAGALPLAAEDVVLAMLPQFHVAAWNCQPLLALWRGATLVLERDFDPARVLSLIGERRVTTMMGVPTQYHLLAEAPGFAGLDLGSLREVLVGGSRMSEELGRTWGERGITVRQGYGLSEAAPNVLVAGHPYPYVEVRITDTGTGAEITGDGTGELQVRGPSVFPGYLGDPGATARAFAGDWLRTGDLAARTDGTYRIVDRLKSIYVSGGENVAPAEVETALAGHPLVDAAVVVGVPDAVWGEVGVAFVVARGGAAITAAEVIAHARGCLAGFKVPQRVVVLEDLPRTGIGKFARAELAGRASQLHREQCR